MHSPLACLKINEFSKISTDTTVQVGGFPDIGFEIEKLK